MAGEGAGSGRCNRDPAEAAGPAQPGRPLPGRALLVSVPGGVRLRERLPRRAAMSGPAPGPATGREEARGHRGAPPPAGDPRYRSHGHACALNNGHGRGQRDIGTYRGVGTPRIFGTPGD